MTSSLVSPEIEAMVGTVLDRRSGTVWRKEFQRWARAVGEDNPLYFDPEYAAAHGYRDVVMPPMFLTHVLLDHVRLDALRPDGVPHDTGIDLPLPERRMAGGNETRFHRAVHPGDVLTATRTLTAVEEKQGRSGAFVLVRTETRFVDQDDVTVAHHHSSMIAR